jgi:hypothetical protein
MTFGEQVLQFNRALSRAVPLLPDGIEAMMPMVAGSEPERIMEEFYGRFYSDNCPRHLILGINPGRLGAGSTGVPFSDTKRLKSECGIEAKGFSTHEPSSVFVYEVIRALGIVESFYRCFYISSVMPLGMVRVSGEGSKRNYNYYDDPSLARQLEPFIVESLEKQLSFGVYRERVFILGKGKNYSYFNRLNSEHGWFEQVEALEHPRYVMQYRNPRKDEYVEKFRRALAPCCGGKG